MKNKKIGILAGTFDPVHKGHIAFALEAAKVCDLERVYLLPERSPRVKKNVSDLEDRLAMLELAVKDHPQLAVLDLPDSQLTISATLPELRSRFAPSQVVFLLGSDVAANLGDWPGLGPLIIGLRGNDTKQKIEKTLRGLKIPESIAFISGPRAKLASSQTRGGKLKDTTDPAVQDYIDSHGLYL